MHVDIRSPIGMMFGIFGALLVIYGLITNGNSMYEQQSRGLNMNLWWGLVILVFGVIMLLLARRGTAKAHLASETPEGRAMEEMEQRKGLEH